MVELGYIEDGELGYLGYVGTRICRIWWNYDMYDRRN